MTVRFAIARQRPGCVTALASALPVVGHIAQRSMDADGVAPGEAVAGDYGGTVIDSASVCKHLNLSFGILINAYLRYTSTK